MLEVDGDRLAVLLAALEAKAQLDGWDAPATLWAVYGVSTLQAQTWADGWGPTPGVREGGYAARFMARDPGQAGFWPDVLRNMAHNFAFAPDDEGVAALLGELRVPMFAGFATVSESWHVPGGFQGEAARRVLAGEVLVKDMPGAVECRVVWCVDRHDRVRSVTRTRGAQPVHSSRQARGDQTTSMRMMVDAVLERLPERTEQAWRQRYPTLAETLLAARGGIRPVGPAGLEGLV